MDNKQSDKQIKTAVRYIVTDVDSAVTFYTSVLGFQTEMHVKSAFASLILGNFRLFLNQPGAGGAGQSMPDGTVPSPGGWNRFQIEVKNIENAVKELKAKGAKFRNEIVNGKGGRQILLQDPSGNLIELFEPAESLVSSQ
jgi:predicted enzyme related to lactoylglutathione lyase